MLFSDLEQSKHLVDSKYYSCWISRTYRRDVICMQRVGFVVLNQNFFKDNSIDLGFLQNR